MEHHSKCGSESRLQIYEDEHIEQGERAWLAHAMRQTGPDEIEGERERERE